MDHRRRQLLLGVGGSIALAGCLDTLSEEAEEAQAAAKNETDDIPTEPDCSLHGELVDDPPAEASVVDADELGENALVDRLFEAARDPDERSDGTTRPSGEYESVSVEPESARELEDAKELLDARPSFDDDAYPPGVYVADGDLTVAIYDVCLT